MASALFIHVVVLSTLCTPSHDIAKGLPAQFCIKSVCIHIYSIFILESLSPEDLLPENKENIAKLSN